MKTKILFLLIALSTFSINATSTKANLVTNNANICVTEQIKGVFDGADEFGYTFILSLEDGEGVIFTFNKLESNVKEVYNLESDDLVGKTFLISFEMVTTKDPNGNEIETDVYTITDLETI